MPCNVKYLTHCLFSNFILRKLVNETGIVSRPIRAGRSTITYKS